MTKDPSLVFFRKASFWWPFSICVLVFIYLYGIQGYATGYGFRQVTLYHDMDQGYRREGGEWSVGRFIPLALLALIYISRKELVKVPPRPNSVIGGILLIFALFLYFAGYKANEKYIGFASGQLLLAGFIFWFLGLQFFLRVFWLYCLAGLMWPWLFLLDKIAFPLQLTMVKLTSTFLSATGADVAVQGSRLLTETVSIGDGELVRLDIGAACSGMRSLFALFMLGLVIAYLQLTSDWKRLVLICCVPVIAVIGNFFRMLALYYGAYFWGSEFAIGEGVGKESSYHINSGFVVFIVAVFLMLTIVQVLTKGARYFAKKKLVVKQSQEVGV